MIKESRLTIKVYLNLNVKHSIHFNVIIAAEVMLS